MIKVGDKFMMGSVPRSFSKLISVLKKHNLDKIVFEHEPLNNFNMSGLTPKQTITTVKRGLPSKTDPNYVGNHSSSELRYDYVHKLLMGIITFFQGIYLGSVCMIFRKTSNGIYKVKIILDIDQVIRFDFR